MAELLPLKVFFYTEDHQKGIVILTWKADKNFALIDFLACYLKEESLSLYFNP